MIGIGALIGAYTMFAIIVGAITMIACVVDGTKSAEEATIITIITALAWPIAILYFIYDLIKSK